MECCLCLLNNIKSGGYAWGVGRGVWSLWRPLRLHPVSIFVTLVGALNSTIISSLCL